MNIIYIVNATASYLDMILRYTISSSLEMGQMICRWIRAIRYPRGMDDRDSISRGVESMCEVNQCTDCELSEIVRYIQVIDSFK
jgi:hypothetical protein